MVISDHFLDEETQLPVISVYGRELAPSRETLQDVDTLVIDLQDVGTRVYTFIHSMALTMKACAKAGVKVLILDRPNPIGGLLVEGNVLGESMASFVGLYPIPMRHGMTIGEMAILCNEHFGINSELQVVPMKGWQRSMHFPDSGLHFVPPSPNIPMWETAMVYPGQVVWEGTNVSEGRGTTRPFELFGAPFILPGRLKERFKQRKLKGVYLRESAFEPCFGKWQSQLCNGFHMHITDPQRYEPYFTSLCLLQDLATLWPEDFLLKEPPYEYEYERQPLDLILGSSELRKAVIKGEDMWDLREKWTPGLNDFLAIREECLLYRDGLCS